MNRLQTLRLEVCNLRKRVNRGYMRLLVKSIEGANKMIVGSVIEDLEIPHEPGNKIGIRFLSGLEMDEAAQIQSQRSLKNYANMKEAYEAIRDPAASAEAALREIDPMLEYDHAYLAQKAIVRWTGPFYNNVPCDDEHKLLMDKPTLDWIIREIINRNHVPLVPVTTSNNSTPMESSTE